MKPINIKVQELHGQIVNIKVYPMIKYEDWTITTDNSTSIHGFLDKELVWLNQKFNGYLTAQPRQATMNLGAAANDDV